MDRPQSTEEREYLAARRMDALNYAINFCSYDLIERARIVEIAEDFFQFITKDAPKTTLTTDLDFRYEVSIRDAKLDVEQRFWYDQVEWTDFVGDDGSGQEFRCVQARRKDNNA